MSPLSQSLLSELAVIHLLLYSNNVKIDLSVYSLTSLICLLSGLSWLKYGSKLIDLYKSLECLTNNFILKLKLFKVIYKTQNNKKKSILMCFSCISNHCLNTSLASHCHYLKLPCTLHTCCTCYFLCLMIQHSLLRKFFVSNLNGPFSEELTSLDEKSFYFLYPPPHNIIQILMVFV